MSSQPAYRLVFKMAGVNDLGASTGSLNLYHGRSLMLASEVFSGGLKSPLTSSPIPPETYRINLSIRGHAHSAKQLEPIPGAPGFLKLHNWYGIEKIDIPEAQIEWGHYRAALNEPRKNMAAPYRGNFLHGKLRGGDYTHGCICERSEKILKWLWELKPRVIPLEVVR